MPTSFIFHYIYKPIVFILPLSIWEHTYTILKASYGVEDPEFAITQLAQTTMRSEIGKMEMDGLFKERENLNISIVQSINMASEAWGIQCMRYEIRDIKLPERIQEAMQMQVSGSC